MPHGEALAHIYDLLMELSVGIDVFVRERAFSRFPNETQALSKVIGIADLTARQSAGAEYEQLAPKAIKKLLVGDGKASKADVAAA